MPRRTGQGQGNDPLVTDKIYHIYNRTIDGKNVFLAENFAHLFLKLVYHCKTYSTSHSQHADLVESYGEEQYRLLTPGTNPSGLVTPSRREKYIPVEIHAYTIMPNHIHLVLKQLVEGGISYYMGRIMNSFTKTYNKLNGRRGKLWEGKFKAKAIHDDPSYLQVLRYVHLNPLRSSHTNLNTAEDLANYNFSSYAAAAGIKKNHICKHSFLHKLISPQDYKDFVKTEVKPAELRFVEDVLIEEPFSN